MGMCTGGARAINGIVIGLYNFGKYIDMVGKTVYNIKHIILIKIVGYKNGGVI